MKNFLLTLAVLLFCTATTRAINNPNYVIGFTQTYFGKLSKRLDQETRLRLLVEKTLSDSITAHTHNLNNPHKVTASLISLGNVNNTSDLSKPVSTATKDSLSALRQSIEAKIPVVPSSLPPSGAAGGSLAGSYPNPTIATSVVLSGSPIVEKNLSIGGDFRLGMNSDAYSGSALFFDPGNRTFVSSDRPEHLIISAPAGLELKASAVNAPTPASSSNNSRVATTAFVKSVFAGVPSSLPPSGAAGGSLAGSYPNPTIATSVVLPGNPTVQGSLYCKKIIITPSNNIEILENDAKGLTIYSANNINIQSETSSIKLGASSVTAPTPATSSNNTQVATTAFVVATHNNMEQRDVITNAGGMGYAPRPPGNLPVGGTCSWLYIGSATDSYMIGLPNDFRNFSPFSTTTFSTGSIVEIKVVKYPGPYYVWSCYIIRGLKVGAM